MGLRDYQRMNLREFTPAAIDRRREFLELADLVREPQSCSTVAVARSAGGSVLVAVPVMRDPSEDAVIQYLRSTARTTDHYFGQFLARAGLTPCCDQIYARPIGENIHQVVRFGERWGSVPGVSWMAYGLLVSSEVFYSEGLSREKSSKPN